MRFLSWQRVCIGILFLGDRIQSIHDVSLFEGDTCVNHCVNPLVFEVIPTLLHVIVLARMQSVFIVLHPLEWLSMRFLVRSCLF